MSTVHQSYYTPKTEKQCLEDTRKFYINKLNELEDEEVRIVNIITSCSEKLMAMEPEPVAV